MTTRRQLIRFGFGLLGVSTLGHRVAIAASPPKNKAQAQPILVLDPGHGGRDPGAIGKQGTREKDVVLGICRAIRGHLQTANRPIKVVLTRTGDEFLPLGDRVEIAHDAGADFFVSIHADSAPNSAARGLSAYTLSEKASDSFASALAKRENDVDVIYGVDLRGTDKETAAILRDLARRHSHNASLTAKKRIVTAAEAANIAVLENPMRSANFAVLRSGSVPSVLIETGFLSNGQDEKLLTNPVRRNQIAKVLADQIAAIAVEFNKV